MTGVAVQMAGRRAILCDLSPAATFIAYNYNTPVDVAAFEREARRILKEVEAECGWMYETWHPYCDAPNRVKGRINYTVWSDVFLCPYCGGEIVFWDAAVDAEAGEVRDRFPCPACHAHVTKRDLPRATERMHDSALGCEIERARQTPDRLMTTKSKSGRNALLRYGMNHRFFTRYREAFPLANWPSWYTERMLVL